MKTIFPKKIQKDDEIRIISPSSSIKRVGGFDQNLVAKERLEKLGYKVTFGDHILENDLFYSSSITARIQDLHQAFIDDNVSVVMTTIGGLNSNELLPYIDWEIIRSHPKVFIGYSDITSLHNAIRAQTGLVTYYGPCYSSFKMNELQEYQTNAWIKVLGQSEYDLQPSGLWTSDMWFDPNIPRKPMPNSWQVYNSGQATGISTGGNIQTYGLQAGTKFLPAVTKPIIFIEQAEGGEPLEFSRELSQMLQIHPDIAALIIGRFPVENKMSEPNLHSILAKFPVLNTIPVVYHVDFGHTQPIFTFPLGGMITVRAKNNADVTIEVLKG